MKHVVVLALAFGCGCGGASGEESAKAPDPLSGGTTTVYDATSSAYSNRAANLTDDHGDAFSLGHSLFNRNWVTAPATTADIDGLGPLFNARSCSACHSHDGRSEPFNNDGTPLNVLIRLTGDTVYSPQFRTNGAFAIPPDGDVEITYTQRTGAYADGTPYTLSVPSYALANFNYGTPPELEKSPRAGPAVIGLGLLEAIPQDALLANANRYDDDGVIGTPNIGRFGWKANVVSVLDQVVGALQADIGITSSLVPRESCTPEKTACLAATSGGSPEIDDGRVAAMALYMRTLAVPARRDVDAPHVMRGEKLFASQGCASCHVTTFQTGELEGVPEVGDQTIHPYTDLLLHDMGEDLADHRADFEATGTQWRTPPLWGIGLLARVNDHQQLLHDARANGFAEAILWHGGEAQTARERFRNASQNERDDLLAFLNSL